MKVGDKCFQYFLSQFCSFQRLMFPIIFIPIFVLNLSRFTRSNKIMVGQKIMNTFVCQQQMYLLFSNHTITIMTNLTIQASISCFLSSSTFFLVSFLSGSASPCLALACCTLILYKADEKVSLMWKVWLGSNSLLFGVLTRILWFGLPIDNGCKALVSSLK